MVEVKFNEDIKVRNFIHTDTDGIKAPYRIELHQKEWGEGKVLIIKNKELLATLHASLFASNDVEQNTEVINKVIEVVCNGKI